MTKSTLLPRGWRWDLLGIGFGALAVQAASLTPNAYFLHFDTPTQDLAALEWVKGCWGDSTLKILPVVLLGPIYRLFGPSQYWETLLLLAWAAVTVALVYELARLISGRRVVGLLAALLLIALPAFQYFSRTHLGYPMPFLLLGWLAAWHKRWHWTGLCFGLAITAHYNSWVPVGLSLVALTVIELRPQAWKNWLGLVVCWVAPLLAMDGLYFFYTGVLFQWDREVFKEAFRLSTLAGSAIHPNWLWVWQTVLASNGLPLTLVLLVGLLAPFASWPQKTGLALLGTFTALAGLYTVQGGLGRALLVSRVLASSYSFWVIGAALGLWFLISRLSAPRAQQWAFLVLGLGAAFMIVETGLFIRSFSQTPYPFIEQAIAQAGQESRPVRYVGNFWIPDFFGQIDGVEVLSGDDRWIAADAPGQAVLIFESQSPASLSRTNYQIQSYRVADQADQTYPGLTEEAQVLRRVEIWWPTQPSLPIGQPADMPTYSMYFSGSGCVTPPAYANHQLHYYQLVWQKLLTALHLN